MATERFVHQELKRIQPTGVTPMRPNANFDNEIINIPSKEELLRQEELMATPRRSSIYSIRDSILESDLKKSIISPFSLKNTLANKKLNAVVEAPRLSLSEESDNI